MEHWTSFSLFWGDQLWCLGRNMVKKPGYPKHLASEFIDLGGNIIAALAVPAAKTWPEAVSFF